MQRFLLRTFLFLLPLLLLASLAEFTARSLPNSYRLKGTWMSQHAKTVETLVLGNSHAYYGIRPSMMKGEAFNLANVSQVPAYDLALLLRYAPLCPRLRQVIMVVDNSCLFDPPLEQSEPHRCTYYTLYMGVGPHSRWGRYGMELFQFDGLCEKLKAFAQGTYTMCDSLGWGTDYTAARSTFDVHDTLSVSQRLQQHQCLNWQWVEANMLAVEKMAHYCQQQGIRFTVIQTPVCSLYNSGIPYAQREAIRKLMHRLATQYHAEVLDFSCDPRFSESDFFDADHLSDLGAAKLTHLLSASQGNL